MPRPLPLRFFARDVLEVAPALLGQLLCRDGVVLRITEVEAYRWPGDTACHARSGRTERNDALWGPPGRAYVYLCYGVHTMLNVVTGADGDAQAVLIRSCEPVEGLPTIQARRGGQTRSRSGPALLAGPGKVGQALDLHTDWSGHPLHRPGDLYLCPGPTPAEIARGPRVGIDFAEPEHQRLPWRFADASSRWVTQRGGLRPPPPKQSSPKQSSPKQSNQ
ncbi:DNA-3-methyladenine glycosylase [Paraliomyxa miuraensis]|uniref:DNA-3-methyladenine glycosylase n=1 Tax=Paraliomyxa miuraensis TaxID=376150 RepID=UPI00225181B7|nr:DNA-3-methyladenine glycosylase [Paraliomyxa miuraensis]MCX4247262.1 DNA-3-methyladenine glycosylase [Paraliomyxa miuraensis]